MRRGSRWVVTVSVSLASTLAGAVALGACIDAIGSDGSISGLSGGDAIAELSPQNPPGLIGPCTDAGMPGAACAMAGTCCGIAAGTEICSFNGTAMGTCTKEPALSTATTWTALYTDYFGPTGRASCAGSGACHGDTSQPGYASSNYQCPIGDKDACYMSITSNGMTTSASIISPGQSFENDELYSVLRKETGGNGSFIPMPLAPVQVYTFTPTDISRIAAWIDAGAPNN